MKPVNEQAATGIRQRTGPPVGPATAAVASPEREERAKRSVMGRVALYAGAGVIVVFLLEALLLPSLCRAREPANRIKCASNERQIGAAILLYAQEHGGRFPDRLEEVLLAGEVPAEGFVCPSSNDEKAPGATVQEAAVNLSKPHHLSYVYVGRALTTAAPPQTPVLYEYLDNHDNDGVNVLFADGHVEFVQRAALEKVLGKDFTATRPISP
jgi:prepilin-type processing-associated H-X9-DG protein